MALRGNLKDFSLPDVFQLVQLSGKTGVLRIQGPEAEGSIWFRDGDVFFAQSNWRREQLGERLVGAQRITPAALARALDLRAAEPEGGRRLGEILVNEGYITEQVLESFVQEQIQDTIFDLMRWDEGDFDFEVLPEVVHEDIGLSVSVENIVMEGSRRLEEWQRIKKKVPSTDMVFKMATAPGEGTFEISLKPVEWALLLLIDGTRSVRELATETRSTDFEVARVVYGLFSAGLLEVPTDEEIERLRADRARRQDKRAMLEAERAELDATQRAQALDLEAQLAADAEVRRAAEASTTSTASVETLAQPEPVMPPVAERVVEEPEFLATTGEAPSNEDMAVFEQMMASVLTPPSEAEAAELQPTATLPEPASIEPEEFDVPVVAEVPADAVFGGAPAESLIEVEEAVAAASGMLPEVEAAPLSDVSETAALQSTEAFAQPLAEAEYGFGALSQADLESIPAPPVAEGASISDTLVAPEPPSITGDFEVDLRSLGLGEYPEELLRPEPPSETRLPMSEIAAGAAALLPDAPATEPPSVEPEVTVEFAVGSESDVVPGVVASDLDSLLASLEAESGSAGVISSGTDYGQDDTSGVISTDAFLAEFDSGDGLSGGLGDELTALTGGGGGRARPVATVAKLPEAGESHMLHRDQMVDRELLEKIIAGIESL